MNLTFQISELLPPNTSHISGENLKQVLQHITNLPVDTICTTINGKLLDTTPNYESGTVRLCGCLLGGKGGFGSMLRAIGAQIEKTTNREACRDLSGRRLRDINEEKRLKTWLSLQKERELEKEEKKKKKIEKLLEEPKHEFKDEAYHQERSNLEDKIHDSLSQGLKRKQDGNGACSSSSGTSAGTSKSSIATASKKPRKRILLDEELDTINDTDDDSDDERAISLCT